MTSNYNIDAFFSLLRAGLWEQDFNLSSLPPIDYSEVYRLAEEQSVIGVISAGLEHVVDIKVPQNDVFNFVGTTLQLEQQNRSMNQFVEELVKRMRQADIYTLLVKGQGIAQCYERPLWRACGDIDFYLSEENFEKAKRFFRPLVESFDPDDDYTRHINMHYRQWVVEIHANQHCSLSTRINRVLDEIHRNLFYGGNVRSWTNGKTQIFLPSYNEDVVIVFTHFLNHFYVGGLGVRQICDWCRLLWKSSDVLDENMLKNQIKKMGLLSEWKAFAAFAVVYLGMPTDAMPLYEDSKKWAVKAERIKDYLLEVGNFGHNRDTSYYGKYPFLIRKTISYCRRMGDLLHHARIFPMDSIRFFAGITLNGLRSVSHGA